MKVDILLEDVCYYARGCFAGFAKLEEIWNSFMVIVVGRSTVQELTFSAVLKLTFLSLALFFKFGRAKLTQTYKLDPV